MAANNFDYKVSWMDFIRLAARPTGEDEDAKIVINFPQSYDYTIDGKAVTISVVSVDINMASPECWVVSSQASNMDLLKHEQGHYDITAIGAREFDGKLFKMTAANETELEKKVKRTRAAIQDKINKANTRYDRQTNHSQDVQTQKTWDQKIDTVKKNPKGIIDDLP